MHINAMLYSVSVQASAPWQCRLGHGTPALPCAGTLARGCRNRHVEATCLASACAMYCFELGCCCGAVHLLQTYVYSPLRPGPGLNSILAAPLMLHERARKSPPQHADVRQDA
jgi:hypothetical protein